MLAASGTAPTKTAAKPGKPSVVTAMKPFVLPANTAFLASLPADALVDKAATPVGQDQRYVFYKLVSATGADGKPVQTRQVLGTATAAQVKAVSDSLTAKLTAILGLN